MKCSWHLCKNLVISTKKSALYCSKKCKMKSAVQKRRTKIKLMAIEYKGGKCEICAYSKSVYALEFHHKDPLQKDFSLSKGGHTRSWERVKNELDKCLILCANCHRETHEQIHLSSITSK